MKDTFIVEYDRLYEIMETTYNEFLDSLTQKQLSKVRCTDFGVCRAIAKRVSKSSRVYQLAHIADEAHAAFMHHSKHGNKSEKRQPSNVIGLFDKKVKMDPKQCNASDPQGPKEAETFLDVMQRNKEHLERKRKERKEHNTKVTRQYKLKQ